MKDFLFDFWDSYKDFILGGLGGWIGWLVYKIENTGKP